MTAFTTSDLPRELAHRANDGLEVALLWFERANRLVVSVVDEKTADRFEVPAEGANALDVFYHPFAHAARCGIEYRTGLRKPEEALAA